MLTLYLSPGCTSSKKVQKWVKDNGLECIERNINEEIISKEELRQILSLTSNGIEDIISTRSKTYRELDLSLEDLQFEEFLELIREKPKLLRCPILIDGRKLQIGFNEDEIRCFLPRNVKKMYIDHTQKMSAVV